MWLVVTGAKLFTVHLIKVQMPTFKGTMSSNANKQSLIPLFLFKSITTYGNINNTMGHYPCLLHILQVNYWDELCMGEKVRVPAVMQVSNGSSFSWHGLSKILFSSISISTRGQKSVNKISFQNLPDNVQQRNNS